MPRLVGHSAEWLSVALSLHTLHIWICALDETLVLPGLVYILWEQQPWLENMPETPHQHSLRFCSCCLSREGTWLPPDRRAPFQSIQTEGDSFTHLHWYGKRAGLGPGWRIKARQHWHLVWSQINFASLKPLQQRQRLKSPRIVLWSG